MSALWLRDDKPTARLERTPLTGGHDERWLQQLLFAHPELIPLDQIEPGSGPVIPVCRELALPKPGGSVFLDLLGVTAHGRPVLVECKLWRNPQARREVVAQLLEYAALLRRWSYADLTTRLRTFLQPGENPLFSHVQRHGGTQDEARFVDAVTRNLRGGDFHLIIAGDGIREDLAAIADHLRDQGARLALVEFQLWSDGSGHTLVVPHLPVRTEVIRQRVIVDAAGSPIQITEDSGEADEVVETAINPDHVAARERNRAFWQRFIDTVRFEHPDQPPSRHGGNGWVKVLLPSPARWLTVYQYKDSLGLSLVAENDFLLLEQLAQEADALRRETGLPDLRFHPIGQPNGPASLAVSRLLSSFATEEEQLAWLADTANRLVSALRPRLAVMGGS